MSKYYTMIGSRSTPESTQHLMILLAKKLCSQGYIGRSGGADGADSALEKGVIEYITENKLPATHAGNYMEIYLPWKDFNRRDSSFCGYYTLPRLHNQFDAEKIASNTHPAWDKCSQGAKKLHTRNVYQLLGKDLATPSKFVICWAEPKYKDRRTEEVLGGTATGVKLGIDNGAEIINLYYQENVDRIKKFLKDV